jgi:hypothetical protein
MHYCMHYNHAPTSSGVKPESNHRRDDVVVVCLSLMVDGSDVRRQTWIGHSRSVKDPSLGHEFASVRTTTVVGLRKAAPFCIIISLFFHFFPLRCF